MEYPDYGIYSGSSTKKKTSLGAKAVYNYPVNEFKIKEEEIFF